MADTVEKPVKKAIDIRRKTQKNEDQWANEQTRLQAEFHILTRENKRLVTAHGELKKTVTSRISIVEEKETRMKEMSRISKELLPYLYEMVERLSREIENDLPFLLAERRERITKLRQLIENDKVTSGEKFRRTLEALFIEMEYGNTVEVFQEKIVMDGEIILTHVFRLGRLSLFFQSLDEQTTGYYDPAISAWRRLPRIYNQEINKSVQIGLKRRSIDLLTLPIGGITVK